MKMTEITIGAEFFCGPGRYRCTDIGTRVVVAIRLDKVNVTQLNTVTKVETSLMLDQGAAEKEGWFSGPPYAVIETVFDEDDLEVCSAVSETNQER